MLERVSWFLLIVLIPIIGTIWILILLCKDGEPGTNKYGENPKDNPKSGGFDDTIEQLKKIAELRDSGVLTEEEFAIQKEKIILKPLIDIINPKIIIAIGKVAHTAVARIHNLNINESLNVSLNSRVSLKDNLERKAFFPWDFMRHCCFSPVYPCLK